MIRRTSAIVALAAAAVFGACDDSVPSTAPVLTDFSAALNGASESPAVVTSATGTASIILVDTNIVRVQTSVVGIDSVTAAHIHAGAAGTPGPIIVGLTPTYALVRGARVARHLPDSATALTGVLSYVDIVRGQTAFTGAFTFDSLLTRMRDGTAYVNVHTTKNPGGEIRGQITAQ
jgi:hypothetical protein